MRTARYMYSRFPRNPSAFSPHKMPSKESKPLGTKLVQTSLRFALSGAPQGENAEDDPLGATTTLAGVSLLDCQVFRPLSKQHREIIAGLA